MMFYFIIKCASDKELFAEQLDKTFGTGTQN